MQSREEIEKSYEKPDPWGYQTNPDDIRRKDFIAKITMMFTPGSGRFTRALDICAGEGWISKYLPAIDIDGYELSDRAAARFPVCVRRVLEPEDKYGLVTLMGALYSHYDWPLFVRLINEHASDIILLCNIEAWEVVSAVSQIEGKQVFEATFPYHEFHQKLRVFER